MKDHVAVLVPCYNESKTIEKVVRDFKRVLPEATVYVYDNNSSDGTGEIAARAGAVVRRERMQGKGSVIRRMFREIDADCYLMVDGDDTYPAEDAPAMVSAVLDEQADMVVGDRLSSTYFTENKRPFHNLGNGLVRASINHLFGSDIKDIMTGYRAFSYAFVKTYPVLSKGFEIETDMTIHAINRRMQVSNIVVSYRDRPDGSADSGACIHRIYDSRADGVCENGACAALPDADCLLCDDAGGVASVYRGADSLHATREGQAGF